MITIDMVSLCGCIHELLGDMKKQGRMSQAEATLIHALTYHPDLPDFFRDRASNPSVPRMPSSTVDVALPKGD